jgi:hypothetical protein
MSVPTPERLRKQARRLDRRIKSTETVLNAMRRGSALHLQYVFSGPVWMLTDGRRVHTATAETAIKHPKIVDVGDALQLSGARSQTYRFVED